ncbi:MAG: SGNH/GDSL hydrolase family protein [Clostridiales bacterium]|nr:SGNH/GDSL hydrolase family protein [Clostridiales bacterium]
MKKILPILLCMIFAIGLTGTACNKGGLKMKILGNNLKDYTVVYGKYEYEDAMKADLSAASYTEWDFNRLIAEEFVAKINEKFGVTLEIKKDTESTETQKEILIGKTNRVSLTDQPIFTPYDYSVGVKNNKLFFYGGCYGTTYAATKYFLDYLADENNYTKKVANIDADFSLQGTHDLITIACIGASNTEGYHPENKFANVNYWSYPATLQRLNWKTTYVYNFGSSGKTMRTDISGASYQATQKWSDCVAHAENFDYVFIKLGTNDFIKDKTTWTDAKKTNFVNSFDNMLTSLSSENPNIKYTLLNFWTPLTEVYNSKIDELLNVCYNNALAKNYNIKFHNLASNIKNDLGPSQFSSDNLHFSSKGYCKFGDLVDKKVLQNLWNI